MRLIRYSKALFELDPFTYEEDLKNFLDRSDS